MPVWTVLPRQATSAGNPTLIETSVAVAASDERFTAVDLQGDPGQECVGHGEEYRLGDVARVPMRRAGLVPLTCVK